MVQKSRNLACLQLAALSMAVAVQPSAHAGNGSFQNGKYKFCASVRFNATPDQLARIRATFSSASQVLADATDGQQSFGAIKIVNNSGASDAADYWINPQAGRAYATYGQYGVRGQHVMLYYPSNFGATSGADGDAYTVAHEHAHHSWGVADEYSGPGGNAEDAPAAANTATLNYSLMDNYFTRGGRSFGGSYTLNEFCTAANHDPDHNTWQHSMHGKSVWETIAAHPTRSATAPTALPVSAAPAAHTVSFADSGITRNTVLLLDRSGSMAIDGRLAAAQQSANQYISLLPVGNGLGIASFSDGGRVDQALTPLTEANRAAKRAAVSALAASGSTNIGGGLLTALGQLTALPDRTCNEVIVLLSDGDHNTGTPPEVGLAAAQAEGVTVLTVALGGDITAAGQGVLQNIAAQTGGKFFRPSSPSELPGVFLQLAAESTGQDLLVRQRLGATVGQAREIPVVLEAGAGSATFAIALADVRDVFDLALRSPSGQVLRATDAVTDGRVRFVPGPAAQTFQVTSPEAGTWTMVATASSVASGRFEAIAYADHPGVRLNAWTSRDILAYPAATELHATATFAGENVVGAVIAGSVRRPDGTAVPVELFDDGRAEHGDTIPGDGVYGARFSQYQGDGTYTFELEVANTTGKTYAGEALFSDQPSNEKPVPAFVRVASTTVVVSGVPETPTGSVTHGPETLNFDSEEQFITLYIELGGRYSAANIDPRSVRVSMVDSIRVLDLYAEDLPAEVRDTDGDGLPELQLKFRRTLLQNLLPPGNPQVTLEGTVDGQPFAVEWNPQFVNTGKVAR